MKQILFHVQYLSHILYLTQLVQIVYLWHMCTQVLLKIIRPDKQYF